MESPVLQDSCVPQQTEPMRGVNAKPQAEDLALARAQALQGHNPHPVGILAEFTNQRPISVEENDWPAQNAFHKWWEENKQPISHTPPAALMSPRGAFKAGYAAAAKDESPCLLTERCLKSEQWREYDFGSRVYRIDNPLRLFTRPGGTTHRVLDAFGVVHCVPAPGQNGCVLRWKCRAGAPLCEF